MGGLGLVLVCGIAAFVLGVIVLAWALCAAAQRADAWRDDDDSWLGDHADRASWLDHQRVSRRRRDGDAA